MLENHVPAEEVVKGMEIRELPPGYMPIEAVLMIKCLDDEGDVCWVNRYTPGPHQIEFLGAIDSLHNLLKVQIARTYEPDEEGD